MIDNTEMSKPFKDADTRAAFMVAFPMIRNDVSRIWDNKRTLESHKGVHLTISDGGTLKVVASLHKFFNLMKGRKSDGNADNFTLSDAQKAFEMLQAFLGLDLLDARVTVFEFGANVQLDKAPSVIMSQLLGIDKKLGFKDIAPDINIRKGYGFSTWRDRNQKEVYAFYDKGQAQKDDRKAVTVANVLRVETKFRRADTYKITQNAGQLFETSFLLKLWLEFSDLYTNKLRFKSEAVTLPEENDVMKEVRQAVKKYGVDGAKAHFEKLCTKKKLGRNAKDYRLKVLQDINTDAAHIEKEFKDALKTTLERLNDL